MNFQFYIEKLFASEEFEKFMKKNKGAFPCSAFFGIDIENIKTPDDKQHIDYLVPSINKMFSFKLEDNVALVEVENFGEFKPNKIALNYDFNFEEVEGKILEEMRKLGMKQTIQKILLSMQNVEGTDYLIGTVFVSSLGMLKANFKLPGLEVTAFEKKSFFDVVNVFKKKE